MIVPCLVFVILVMFVGVICWKILKENKEIRENEKILHKLYQKCIQDLRNPK